MKVVDVHKHGFYFFNALKAQSAAYLAQKGYNE